MRVRSVLFAALAMLFATAAFAREDRSIFTKAFNAIQDKSSVFKPGGEWFPYPAYRDRAGWDAMSGTYKDELIKNGERFLKHKWTPVPASVYLEYEETKDRGLMRKYDYPNREALADMTLAELAEGKGRFMTQIINGVMYAAERTTWSHAQHTPMQYSGRTLPVREEPVVTLLAASYALNVALAWHFFHEEWDKIDPSISRSVLAALEHNTFEPYMNRDWGWMGFGRKEGQRVNNWNCHCNFFCTAAFLLADQNPERLLKAVERSLYSFDQYMDYAEFDGACEEGPGYWTMAGGKVYDYARMMYDASAGKIDVLKDSQVRNMGEFMVSSYIGDGWQLDFGDGDARQGDTDKNRDLFLRFGHDTGSASFENLGLSLLAIPEKNAWDRCAVASNDEGKEEYRSLEVLRSTGWLAEDCDKALAAAGGDWNRMKRNLESTFGSIWYESTQVAVLRNRNGWYLGAKAGNNGESHGHHDVGSAIVFVDQCPVFVDPGVMTYGKETFGELRYTQWWAVSDWHNIAVINGSDQGEGPEYHATEVSCNPEKGIMQSNIAAAYPEDAKVSRWTRSYRLTSDALTIRDSYSLKERLAADDIHFVTPGDVFLPGSTVDGRAVAKGEVVIRTASHDGKRQLLVKMTYPKALTPELEVKDMTDPRFMNAWHDKLCRISFRSAGNAPLAASYDFILTRLK